MSAPPLPDFAASVQRNLRYSLGKRWQDASPRDLFTAVSLATRESLIEQMLATEERYRAADAKRLYYLSIEFLMGRSLGNNLLNLGMLDPVRGDAGRRSASTSRRCASSSRTRRSATAASAGSPPATSTRSPASTCPASATASTTSTACSARRSRTASSASTPTAGARRARPG